MSEKSIAEKDVRQQLRSPEQLDDYINVSNPSIWLVVGVFLALMIGVIVWGAVGTLPKTLAVKGVLLADRQAVCYVDAGQMKTDLVGKPAQLKLPNGSSIEGTVEQVSEIPFSKAEIAGSLQNDWIFENLATSNYTYEVVVNLSEEPAMSAGTLLDITLITDEVKPIEFVLGRR